MCRGQEQNSPEHLLNFVDRNCVPYTPLELFLFVTGCLLWVWAYVLLLRNTRRKKFIEFPAVAVCSDLAWEITWSVFFTTDMGRIPAYIYKAWLLLDVFIFWQLLKHGRSQPANRVLRDNFTWLCLVTVPVFVGIYCSFVDGGFDTPIGATSAYLAQQLISVPCLLLLLGSESPGDFSTLFAWLRSVGTAMVAVFFFLHYQENHFLQLLGALSIVLDSTFLWLLRKKRHASVAVPGRSGASRLAAG